MIVSRFHRLGQFASLDTHVDSVLDLVDVWLQSTRQSEDGHPPASPMPGFLTDLETDW